MELRSILAAMLIVIVLAISATQVRAEEAQKPPIKIGYINAFTEGSFFVQPNKKAIDLAVSEINASGGVLGRPLLVLPRDSKMNPGKAVRLAEELKNRDKIDVLMNCDGSNTTIAVNEWVNRNPIPFVISCSEADSVIWEHGSDYAIRVNAGGYGWVSASLEKALEVHGDALKNKRWVSIGPNLEFGRYLLEIAKDKADVMGLNARWVAAQWPEYQKLNAGSTISALEMKKPDVVFVTLFGNDVSRFVLEAKKRNFIKDRIFIFPTLALPEHLEMLKKDMPQGWISVSYPYEAVRKDNPYLDSFMKRYEEMHKESVRSSYAVGGYDAIYAIAAAIEKAGSLEPSAIKDAFPDLKYKGVHGDMTINRIDHQADATFWVGTSGIFDGEPGINKISEFNMRSMRPADDAVRMMREREKR